MFDPYTFADFKSSEMLETCLESWTDHWIAYKTDMKLSTILRKRAPLEVDVELCLLLASTSLEALDHRRDQIAECIWEYGDTTDPAQR